MCLYLVQFFECSASNTHNSLASYYPFQFKEEKSDRLSNIDRFSPMSQLAMTEQRLEYRCVSFQTLMFLFVSSYSRSKTEIQFMSSNIKFCEVILRSWVNPWTFLYFIFIKYDAFQKEIAKKICWIELNTYLDTGLLVNLLYGDICVKHRN